jgi:hypothetical protein
MGSETERKFFGDVQPQGEGGEERGHEEEADGEVAAFLENADEGRDEEEVGDGFHGRRLRPGGWGGQAEKSGVGGGVKDEGTKERKDS